MIVRQESRCRIGITWYDTEDEANKVGADLHNRYDLYSISAANIGFAQCGRAPEYDRPGEYAVITP